MIYPLCYCIAEGVEETNYEKEKCVYNRNKKKSQ